MLRLPRAPALFLDFDGCLVDIAPTPDAVRVPNGLRESLARLARATNGALAIVSGRSIRELRRFLSGLDVPLIGSHGAERAMRPGRIDTLDVDRRVLAELTEKSAAILRDHPGLLLEQKPVAVGLHFRNAPAEGPRIIDAATQVVAQCPGFHLHHAKALVEIRPDGIGKGDAVAGLLRQRPFQGRVPIVMGDDATDEPAFAVAHRHDGLSIKVGPGETGARQRLGAPAQVRATLARWAEQLDA